MLSEMTYCSGAATTSPCHTAYMKNVIMLGIIVTLAEGQRIASREERERTHKQHKFAELLGAPCSFEISASKEQHTTTDHQRHHVVLDQSSTENSPWEANALCGHAHQVWNRPSRAREVVGGCSCSGIGVEGHAPFGGSQDGIERR